MKTNTKFNDFVKKARIEKRTSLREFCRKTDLDPSNWSKIERGYLLPPKDPETLGKIAEGLGFEKDGENYKILFELAAIASIPAGIIEENVLEKIPLFFRTLRGNKPTEAELRELFNFVQINR